jgi:predicted MFS family arabinose efflux permease
VLKYHARRPATHHEHPEGKKIARLALIVNIGDAAFWTILPIQLVTLAGSDSAVGFYYVVIAVVGTGAAVLSTGTFRRHRKVVVGATSLLAMVLLLFGMAWAGDIVTFALFDIPRAVAFMLVTIVLGLMVRDFASAADLAVEEGRFYQYSNVGWLIGPVSAGYVAAIWGTEVVFVLISAVFAFALAYLWHLHLRVHPAMEPGADIEALHSWAEIGAFFSERRFRQVFAIAFGLEFWWIVSSIFIPLAVIGLGYGPEVVGLVVTGGVVPLVLLETWVGRKAKQVGVSRYIVAGFATLAFGCLSFVVLGDFSVLLLVLFAVVNVGAALIEPLKDTYYFGVTSKSESDEYFGIYNASVPIASLVGPLAGALVITVGFGLDGVWILSAVVLALCAAVGARLVGVSSRSRAAK